MASLTAALRQAGYSCDAWDVNAEFIHHLTQRPALRSDLTARLERRLVELYRRRALDHSAQQEARSLINALDTLHPLVARLVGPGMSPPDRGIVGDHDKDLPRLLLLELAALDAFTASQSPYLESYNAELPLHAHRVGGQHELSDCEDSQGRGSCATRTGEVLGGFVPPG